MREAKSYSIVDHALLHGGYLGRLSHAALALYLFLVVVGDREGRSFYSDASVGGILRLLHPALVDARRDLIAAGLIRFQRPYWWVESLSKALPPTAPLHPCTPSLASRREARPPCPAPEGIRHVVPEALKALIRSLEERS